MTSLVTKSSTASNTASSTESSTESSTGENKTPCVPNVRDFLIWLGENTDFSEGSSSGRNLGTIKEKRREQIIQIVMEVYKIHLAQFPTLPGTPLTFDQIESFHYTQKIKGLCPFSYLISDAFFEDKEGNEVDTAERDRGDLSNIIWIIIKTMLDSDIFMYEHKEQAQKLFHKNDEVNKLRLFFQGIGFGDNVVSAAAKMENLTYAEITFNKQILTRLGEDGKYIAMGKGERVNFDEGQAPDVNIPGQYYSRKSIYQEKGIPILFGVNIGEEIGGILEEVRKGLGSQLHEDFLPSIEGVESIFVTYLLLQHELCHIAFQELDFLLDLQELDFLLDLQAWEAKPVKPFHIPFLLCEESDDWAKLGNSQHDKWLKTIGLSHADAFGCHIDGHHDGWAKLMGYLGLVGSRSSMGILEGQIELAIKPTRLIDGKGSPRTVLHQCIKSAKQCDTTKEQCDTTKGTCSKSRKTDSKGSPSRNTKQGGRKKRRKKRTKRTRKKKKSRTKRKNLKKGTKRKTRKKYRKKNYSKS